MFIQYFKLKRGLVTIDWLCRWDGEIRLVKVGDTPANQLSLPEYYEAYGAVEQRMAERGPHAKEPKP